MAEESDMELVRNYDRQGSEEAFAEPVRRHLGLVYSAAFRQVGMAAQAMRGSPTLRFGIPGGKHKIHIGESARPPPVIGQVRQIVGGRLGTDKKVRQHRIIRRLAAILPERLPGAPGVRKIQFQPFKPFQIFVHALPGASSRRQFGISDAADRERVLGGRINGLLVSAAA